MSDLFPLVEGPYAAPACAVGDKLTCALRGPLVVVGFTAAPIPWPLGRLGEWHVCRYLIVCGDLLRALEHESRRVIAREWGVRVLRVARWRRALPDPKAMRRLHRYYAGCRRLAARKRARLLACAAKVPAWRPEGDALLGTATDRALAARVGVSYGLVRKRRTQLGVPGYGKNGEQRARPWTKREDRLLGTMPDRELARCPG